MGLFKGAAKAGLAAKAFEVLRREAAKPQNQAKARELVQRLTDRSGRRGAAGATPPAAPAAGRTGRRRGR